MSEINGVKFENGQIVCTGITVTSTDKAQRYTASIKGLSNGVGFWMSEKGSPDSNLIAIYKIGDHTVIGLYDGDKSKQPQAIDMGLCSCEDGAFIQVTADGKVIQISKEQLLKLKEADNSKV